MNIFEICCIQLTVHFSNYIRHNSKTKIKAFITFLTVHQNLITSSPMNFETALKSCIKISTNPNIPLHVTICQQISTTNVIFK